MKPRFIPGFVLCTLVLITAAGAAGARYFYAYQKAAEAHESLTQELLRDQERAIVRSSIQIAALLAANQSVATELKSEAEKRLAAEQANRTAQNKLTQLEQTVESNKAPSASAVIKEWRPRVAAVRCVWPVKDGKQAAKLGTAVLMPSQTSASPVLLTSKHVLTSLNELPESCALTFPDHEEKVEVRAEGLAVSDTKYDWGKITLSNPPTYATVLAATPATRCTAAPLTGDSVIILGYPKIGIKADITATEGIVSGFESDYYITSAKVERGNSGGAAILTKQNCYLGIPTFVDVGEAESLARILDQSVIPN